MLVAIISIYWLTGTTDITQIYEINNSTRISKFIMVSFPEFFFAVKMPMWPVHTWFPMLMWKLLQLDQ